MATIYDIRRVNLSLLLNMKYGGIASRLAEKMGRKPSYLSRMFMNLDKGGRNMGDKLAREIEAASDLSSGWMDIVHPDEYMEYLPSSPPQVREKAAKAVRDLLVNNGSDAQVRRAREDTRHEGRQSAAAAYQAISDTMRNMPKFQHPEKREWNTVGLSAVIQSMTADQSAKLKAALMIADIPEQTIEALTQTGTTHFQALSPDELELMKVWRAVNENGRIMIANAVRAAMIRFPLQPAPDASESPPTGQDEVDLFDFKDFPQDSGKGF